MNKIRQNIFPISDKALQSSIKEKHLNQKAKVIWLTGLSGSGKTTLALGLERELFELGYLARVLDGDDIRSGINKNLGFSQEDRIENIRRIAEVSKLFIKSGIITINGVISPTEEMRNMARMIIGEDDFIEIYVNSSLEVCEARDSKGLYKKARRGEILDFTGVNSPFEDPITANLEIRTDELTIAQSLEKAMAFILPKIEYKEV
ncbi:MAG: adenylyl-sulfate kinase [Bacteroidales bacterium]|nr:adenylyl-sulfate kinase [Bacteroidales bacterium]